MPITVIDVEKDPLYLKGVKKGKEEGLKEGLERGLEQKAKEDVIKLRRKLKLSPEQIAEILDLPVEKVVKWLKEEGLLKN